VQEERPITQSEQRPAEHADHLDEARGETNPEDQRESASSDNPSASLLLAGLIISQTSADAQRDTSISSSEASTQVVDAAVDGSNSVTAVPSSSVTPQPLASATQSSALAAPQQAVSQPPADGGGNEVTPSASGIRKGPDSPATEEELPEAMLLRGDEQQTLLHDVIAVPADGSETTSHVQANTIDSLAAMTASHTVPKSRAGADTMTGGELQSPFEAVVQAADVSAGHSTAGPDQFFGQEQATPESKDGSNHTKSGPSPSEDRNLRPQFLDQATAISPSASPGVEGRAGRGETAQSVVIHGPQGTRDLPGATPATQTVTLDLDPLDMGPLRVRIMMTEQTVHTHIRTEHGELGQGLMQNGPSLEASLRSTGFEMGTLRVTVDQQQQSRGDHPWTFQQQQNRSESPSRQPAVTTEHEGVLLASQEIGKNGRVSWFA
jgi:flagellar hook-length control protein FliK